MSEPGADARSGYVVELDTRRRSRRRARRGESPEVVVVLPHTEGEVAAVLGGLEELLLADLDADELVVDADPAAVAVGELASYVSGVERGEPAVQPLAPDRRYELGPLYTVLLAGEDLERIVGAIAALQAASADALRSRFGTETDAARFVTSTQRLGALLSLPWDDDVDVLRAHLGPTGDGAPARPVLSEAEYAAYGRVSGRILSTWHAGDAIAPFLYDGR